MDQPCEDSINLQKVQAHTKRYSKDVHPIVSLQSAGAITHPDELKSIHDALQLLHASLARDLAVLQLYMRNPDNEEKTLENALYMHGLSGKEEEVLTMFAKGCSYTEAAELLGCKLGTIQTHAKRIYKKLRVHSRSEAVFEARQLGLIQL